ncbi:MAG: hypothetical protein JNK64_13140 [Myxococcales bacterium]|nr:hypothetical protein [Myxococcales bacterium]
MSGLPPVVELAEWSEKVLAGHQLGPADRRLVESERRAGRVLFEELRGGLRVQARSWVGVIRLSAVEVRIVPKLAGGEASLVKMVDLLRGLETLARHPGGATLERAGDGLLDLFITLLCDASDRVVRDGIVADYVERDEELRVVRGRLLVDRQVRERFGRVDRLLCRHDERLTDIIENQLLATALELGARRARGPTLRDRARRLADAFAEVCEPAALDLDAARRGVVYHRQNAHYRRAHGLALLVLDEAGIDSLHKPGPVESFAFLLDMNRLFEELLTKVVQVALADTTARVQAQRRDGSVLWDATRGRSYARVIPDLLVSWEDVDAKVPIDAKYKLYDEDNADPADLYQAFLYASAYGDGRTAANARALLVYPSAQPTIGVDRLQVRRSAQAVGELAIVGIPLAGVVDELCERGGARPLCRELGAIVVGGPAL